MDTERHLDYAADGTVIGVEITCTRSGVTTEDLPERRRIEAVLEKLHLPLFA